MVPQWEELADDKKQPYLDKEAEETKKYSEECKAAGIIDSPENLWDFFLDKVRKYLHVCLCFSPVGDKFRIRARNFPALINCTVIDWFQPWPHEALVSVAGRFLAEIPDIEPELLENLQFHCAFTHTAVNDASIKYLEEDRRYNYTTPKSYLELISLYKDMLASKRSELKQAKEQALTQPDPEQKLCEDRGADFTFLLPRQIHVKKSGLSRSPIFLYLDRRGPEPAVAFLCSEYAG